MHRTDDDGPAVEDMIAAATKAPSGDNCQPWRFVVTGLTIRIYNVASRGASFFNHRERGSHMAIGAAIENIAVAARSAGYVAQVALFPDPACPELVAAVVLSIGSGVDDGLRRCIDARASNRKPYRTIPLTAEEKAALVQAGTDDSGAQMVLIEEAGELLQLIEAATLSEKVVFETKHLHDYFFGGVSWTEEEERRRRRGLSVAALELSLPQRLALRQVRHWPIMRALNLVGFSNAVRKSNTLAWSHAAACCAIVVKNTQDKEFVNAGRLLQRIWLNAVRIGLHAQPLAGTVLFGARVAEGRTDGFLPEHIPLIRAAYESIRQVVGVPDGVVAILLRIGHADPPSARSSRLLPDVEQR